MVIETKNRQLQNHFPDFVILEQLDSIILIMKNRLLLFCPQNESKINL